MNANKMVRINSRLAAIAIVAAAVALVICLLIPKMFFRHRHDELAILHNDLAALHDLMLVKLADAGDGVVAEFVDSEDINNPKYVSLILEDVTPHYFKSIVISNGVVADAWQRRIHIEIVRLKNPSLGERNFDLRIWSDGKNGTNERGAGDDVNNWSFPDRP